MFLSLREKLYFCAHETRDTFVKNDLTCQLFSVWVDEMNLSSYSQNVIEAVK